MAAFNQCYHYFWQAYHIVRCRKNAGNFKCVERHSNCWEFYRSSVCWFSLLKLSLKTFLHEITLIIQTMKRTSTKL